MTRKELRQAEKSLAAKGFTGIRLVNHIAGISIKDLKKALMVVKGDVKFREDHRRRRKGESARIQDQHSVPRIHFGGKNLNMRRVIFGIKRGYVPEGDPGLPSGSWVIKQKKKGDDNSYGNLRLAQFNT